MPGTYGIPFSLYVKTFTPTLDKLKVYGLNYAMAQKNDLTCTTFQHWGISLADAVKELQFSWGDLLHLGLSVKHFQRWLDAPLLHNLLGLSLMQLMDAFEWPLEQLSLFSAADLKLLGGTTTTHNLIHSRGMTLAHFQDLPYTLAEWIDDLGLTWEQVLFMTKSNHLKLYDLFDKKKWSVLTLLETASPAEVTRHNNVVLGALQL